MDTKRRVWDLVETAEGDDLPSRLVDTLIITLIVASVAVVILDSVPDLLAEQRDLLLAFESFATVVFTIEYVLRLWSCVSQPAYRRPFLGRLRYATTPLALIDLLAIAPFYLPWLLPRSLLFLRVLRLVRLLRLFKVGRYSDAPKLVARAFRRRRAELLAALFVLGLLVVSMGGLLYLAENPYRPRIYSSIPVSMWWSILALTGNGQVAPITLAGRMIASFIAILGVGLFALPAGLLASAFTEELGTRSRVGGRLGDHEVEQVTERVALAHVEKRRSADRERVGADYAPAALIVTSAGTAQGIEDGLRLLEPMHGEDWRLERFEIAGEVAALEWRHRKTQAAAFETIVVRGGSIQLQTIAITDGAGGPSGA